MTATNIRHLVQAAGNNERRTMSVAVAASQFHVAGTMKHDRQQLTAHSFYAGYVSLQTPYDGKTASSSPPSCRRRTIR